MDERYKKEITFIISFTFNLIILEITYLHIPANMPKGYTLGSAYVGLKRKTFLWH